MPDVSIDQPDTAKCAKPFRNSLMNFSRGRCLQLVWSRGAWRRAKGTSCLLPA